MADGSVATTSRRSDSSALASTLSWLKHRWEASGTSLRQGVSEHDIRAFERRYRVTLPDDLAEYFRRLDGMNDGETDERLMRFWRLDELRPIHEVTPPLGMPYHGFFCFADCPLGTYDDPLGTPCYAIRLLPGAAHVIIIRGNAVSCVADSFSQFLDAYLGGSRASVPFMPPASRSRVPPPRSG
jgi:hypothetical protein